MVKFYSYSEGNLASLATDGSWVVYGLMGGPEVIFVFVFVLLLLLAPTGALIVTVVYYRSAAAASF